MAVRELDSFPRLVTVSNRLPVVVEQGEGGLEVRTGSGGLVTALAPILRHRGGIWIGWPGPTGEEGLEELLRTASADAGYELRPVLLSAAQVRLFYDGFCNEVLWPLFHDLQSRCVFRPEYWRSYQEVNRRFARAVTENVDPGDFVWVHDYHLLLFASALRELGRADRTAFFLHTPFPSVDILLKLPWRSQVLRAMLDYGLLGFQTMRDRRNFLECVLHFWPDVRTSGRGPVIDLHFEGRDVRLGAFPIGIDYREFASGAQAGEVEETVTWLRERYPGQQIILGVDRLDYTKGIPERLEAFRTALERYPELRGKVTLVQVAVPSRAAVPEYQSLRDTIEGLIGKINGEYTAPGWVPIHYLYRSLSREELLAYYRASDVALVTPLKDGMNLVAKEFCAANVDSSAVLVLSEFAGAASQLSRWALTVNPNDVEGMAEAIRSAVLMPPRERRHRMRRLRKNVKNYDIHRWVRNLLAAAPGLAPQSPDRSGTETVFTTSAAP